MGILAISGSLRKGSYNTALLKAMKNIELENMSIEIYARLGTLPFFNGDLNIHTLEKDDSPSAIVELLKKVTNKTEYKINQ